MITNTEINKNIFKRLFLNKENLTIFDVGTYDGKDSAEFSKIFPKSKIYAFEADQRSINLFKKVSGNVKNINLIETALSNVDGEIEWYASNSETRKHYDFQEEWSASSSIKKPENHLNVFTDISFSKVNKVKSLKLDTWVSQNPNINEIDIMWVDVNGGEKEFLDGGLNTLNTKVKYLYIEFNSTNNKSLYEGCPTKDEITQQLNNFEDLGVYNFMGNFGNILLKNKHEF